MLVILLLLITFMRLVHLLGRRLKPDKITPLRVCSWWRLRLLLFVSISSVYAPSIIFRGILSHWYNRKEYDIVLALDCNLQQLVSTMAIRENVTNEIRNRLKMRLCDRRSVMHGTRLLDQCNKLTTFKTEEDSIVSAVILYRFSTTKGCTWRSM